MPVALSVDRIQGLSGSLAIKIPVDCATTAAITLSGLQTIDDVVLAEGDRVLVKDQTDLTTNGLYTATTSTWQRTLDFNRSNDATQGTLVHVIGGTSNAGLWQLTTADPVIGTSDLEFAEFATGTGTGGGGGGTTTNYYATFIGDGTTGPFCLPVPPGSIANTLVVVNGTTVLVPNIDYTLTDSCISLTVASTIGDAIFVSYSTATAVSTTLLVYRYTVTGSEVGNAIALPYTYTPGSNTLAVFHRGVYEDTPAYYAETDSQTVTFTYDLVTGHEYVFIIGQLVNNGDTLVVGDGTITANKLAADAVTTAKILNGNVTLAKMADIATTKLLGRKTAGTGAPEAVTIADFIAESVLDSAADYLLMWDASAGLHKKVLLGAVRNAGTRTWSNKTSSRLAGTAYQNTSGDELGVGVEYINGDSSIQTSVNGTSGWITVAQSASGNQQGPLYAPITNGWYYKLVASGGSLSNWAEYSV